MDAKLTTQDTISPLIKDELQGYTDLIEVLGRERHLLVSRNFDALTDVLGEKHALITRLDKTNTHRIDFLNQNNLPVSSDGMKILISERSQQKEQTLDEWERIFILIQRCADLNEINAKITHRAQYTTGHILSILRGQGGAPDLYSNKGKARAVGNALAITKA